jgi:hypothetical protein
MMEERNRFIDPKRMGTWVVVALGVAVLALVTAFAGLQESRLGGAATQVEILKLHERLLALERVRVAPKPAEKPAATN